MIYGKGPTGKGIIAAIAIIFITGFAIGIGLVSLIVLTSWLLS